MLLINPHLAWGNTFYRYMQVHLVGPDYDQVGTPQVGFPVAVVGFNRHTGWGRTVNTIDTVDFYKLTVQNDQYLRRVASVRARDAHVEGEAGRWLDARELSTSDAPFMGPSSSTRTA
jgi:acyl-homoserine lactone acylase PvdQ